MSVDTVKSTNLLYKAIQRELHGNSTNFNGQKNNKTSIFYINDIHGKSINVERTVAASNAFDSFVKTKKDTDTGSCFFVGIFCFDLYSSYWDRDRYALRRAGGWAVYLHTGGTGVYGGRWQQQ